MDQNRSLLSQLGKKQRNGSVKEKKGVNKHDALLSSFLLQLQGTWAG